MHSLLTVNCAPLRYSRGLLSSPSRLSGNADCNYLGVLTASGDAFSTVGILKALSKASNDSTASSKADICGEDAFWAAFNT